VGLASYATTSRVSDRIAFGQYVVQVERRVAEAALWVPETRFGRDLGFRWALYYQERAGQVPARPG